MARMVKKEGPNRRDVLAGAAAFGMAALVPFPVARPAFVAARAEFMEALEAYRQACDAAFIARPRIMAEVRKTDITAFFNSDEIKTRARTRTLASVAARNVYVPEAANDAEAAMQDEALTIAEEELSAENSPRNCYPPHRHLTV